MIQRGSKWTQNKVFQLPLKMGACIFSASLHEVSNGQSENILNDFLEKILFWGYCTKLHLTGAEMRFFKYYKKSRLAIFLKFCLKSKQHEVLKFALFFWGGGGMQYQVCSNALLWKNLLLEFLWKKRAKMSFWIF